MFLLTPKQIEIYTRVLQDLIYSVRNDAPEVHNSVWLTKYDWAFSVDEEEKIAIFLALVHPDFYKNQQGNNISNYLHPPHPPAEKKPSLPEDNRNFICQLNVLLPNAVCPWRDVGVTIDLDHKWPYSLGGTSTLDNRLELCSNCNINKSSSFHLYPTNRGIPTWLSDRVQELNTIKRN